MRRRFGLAEVGQSEPPKLKNRRRDLFSSSGGQRSVLASRLSPLSLSSPRPPSFPSLLLLRRIFRYLCHLTMAHVPVSRNPQATPTEIAANSPSPRDLKPGVVLPWEGPSLTRGILPPVEPRFGETKHRKLESVLVGDYGPAGKARSEPWTLRLVGTLGHAALQGSEQHASQIWKCSAKRGKTPTEISVVLKLYVPPLESRISRYERTPPVRKTSRIDHKMKWDEGKNLIDREAMVYK